MRTGRRLLHFRAVLARPDSLTTLACDHLGPIDPQAAAYLQDCLRFAAGPVVSPPSLAGSGRLSQPEAAKASRGCRHRRGADARTAPRPRRGQVARHKQRTLNGMPGCAARRRAHRSRRAGPRRDCRTSHALVRRGSGGTGPGPERRPAQVRVRSPSQDRPAVPAGGIVHRDAAGRTIRPRDCAAPKQGSSRSEVGVRNDSTTRRPRDRSRSLSVLSPSSWNRASCACCAGRPSSSRNVLRRAARAGQATWG